jgi:hypothetical protein
MPSHRPGGISRWAASATASRERVRALNDQLRQHGTDGTVVITPGVRALGLDQVRLIKNAVASFSAFDADNDPYGEHDCAVLTVGAERVIWKIDYYDRSLRGHSPDPADPSVTTRVLTIMLAEEY